MQNGVIVKGHLFIFVWKGAKLGHVTGHVYCNVIDRFWIVSMEKVAGMKDYCMNEVYIPTF